MDEKEAEKARKRYHFHSSCKLSQKEKTAIKRCPVDCDCSDDSCPNVCEWKECPAVCNKKPGKCQNQHFRSKAPLPVEIKKTKEKGLGLFANKTIKPNSLPLPFVGQVVTMEEWEKRAVRYARDNIPSYPFGSNGYIIDATVHGNATKFINHSCVPNLRAETWKVDGAPRDFRAIALIPIKAIKKGEELTLNYRFGAEDTTNIECTCGAKKECSGRVGKRKEDPIQKVLKVKEVQKISQSKIQKNQKVQMIQTKNKIQQSKVQQKKKKAQKVQPKIQKKKEVHEVQTKTKVQKIEMIQQKHQKIKKTKPKIPRIPVTEIRKPVLRSRGAMMSKTRG